MCRHKRKRIYQFHQVKYILFYLYDCKSYPRFDAAESTYSTNDIFDLPPDVRNCLQHNEKKMEVFNRYSYVNCMAECRSSIVNEFCGCVPFTLPNNGSFPKCKVSQLKCVRQQAFRFTGSVFQINNDSSENSRNLRKKCHCLPDCTFYT